ncbi:MAG: RES family NAD+ phosphorylase [Deltaproteobacteria bacterium]|nr:RES family NAD+ phosphorylase [Deltaproteobacteria bacterium]
MTAWRLIKETHIKDAFTGEGARLYGGRWNHRGIPAVYISESLSLSILEQFVHLGFEGKDIRFAYIQVHIPQNVRIDKVRAHVLPADWRSEPAPNSTKEMGSGWLEAARFAVLKVPSVIVPVEYNYVLNPSHPDFKEIKISKSEPYCLDQRMW